MIEFLTISAKNVIKYNNILKTNWERNQNFLKKPPAIYKKGNNLRRFWLAAIIVEKMNQRIAV